MSRYHMPVAPQWNTRCTQCWVPWWHTGVGFPETRRTGYLGAEPLSNSDMEGEPLEEERGPWRHSALCPAAPLIAPSNFVERALRDIHP